MASQPLQSCPYLSSPLLFSGEELLQLNIWRLASSQNRPLQDSIPASLHSFHPPNILCPRACHDAMLGTVFSEVKSCFVVPLAAERMDASQMRFCMNGSLKSKADLFASCRQAWVLYAGLLKTGEPQDLSRSSSKFILFAASAHECGTAILHHYCTRQCCVQCEDI